MGELTEGVNWLAVGVGTVLSFLLGWAWYSPVLFVKKWIEGINVKPNPNAKMPAAAMVMQLIATFLLAWLVGIGAAHNALATTILIAYNHYCIDSLPMAFSARRATTPLPSKPDLLLPWPLS